MKATSDETKQLGRISKISGQDISVVRSVFKGLQFLHLTTIYGLNEEGMNQIEDKDIESFELLVPYLCSLNIKHDSILSSGKKRIKLDIDVEPSEDFLREFENVINGEETNFKKYVKRGVLNEFLSLIQDNTKVNIDEDEEQKDTL